MPVFRVKAKDYGTIGNDDTQAKSKTRTLKWKWEFMLLDKFLGPRQQ